MLILAPKLFYIYITLQACVVSASRLPLNINIKEHQQTHGVHGLHGPNRSTRSSDIITLQRPLDRSRLKVTGMLQAPVLWNSIPKQLRQPSVPPSLGSATDSTPLLALSSHQFHS